ncbi:MAG: hypothetical protein AAFP19_20630, partial [Bacteroidota bacterium]
TSFDIIPVETTQITFRQVLEQSEVRINTFLAGIGEKRSITLQINLHENAEAYVKDVSLDAPFEWKRNEYIWLMIEGIAGGTDAYCRELKDERYQEDPWWKFEDMISNSRIPQFDQMVEKAKKLNRYWSFRRSAGQPAIINLAYGLISMTVAELSGGFVWTEDGAWTYKKFPALPNDFSAWYFQPDVEEEESFSHWARGNLRLIPKELNAI